MDVADLILATLQAAWKRKIAVMRRTAGGSTSKASLEIVRSVIDELSHYLDTFYTDVEAWLELADLYITYSQFANALQTLNQSRGK